MPNPVLVRLMDERAAQVDFIDGVLTRVESESRDLVDAEKANLSAARERIAAIDAQREPLESFESLRSVSEESTRIAYPERLAPRPASSAARPEPQLPRSSTARPASSSSTSSGRAATRASRSSPTRRAGPRRSGARSLDQLRGSRGRDADDRRHSGRAPQADHWRRPRPARRRAAVRHEHRRAVDGRDPWQDVQSPVHLAAHRRRPASGREDPTRVAGSQDPVARPDQEHVRRRGQRLPAGHRLDLPERLGHPPDRPPERVRRRDRRRRLRRSRLRP